MTVLNFDDIQSPARRTGRPVARSVEDLIGDTPLVRLDLLSVPPEITVLAKLEAANPLSSIKDRTSLYMLRGAEARGQLTPGRGTVVEATSGNTGIALAALAAARKYRCVVVMPDSATAERLQVLRALGAEVVLTSQADGYAGAVQRAEAISAGIAGAWFARQHENQDNIRAHFETTGPEIWADCAGRVDALVCGVGTGGTLTGVAGFLKNQNPDIRVVAVEPQSSPVLSGGPGGTHAIPGLNGGFIAPTTDVSLIDQIVVMPDQEAKSAAQMLARTAGLLVGISSGAAVAGSIRVAQELPAGSTLVTILPDTGERYLSIWDAETGQA